MDIVTHGLWATAAGKAVNIKSPERVNLKWMAVWGIMPDVLSFAPVVVWVLWQMLFCGVDFAQIPRPELLPPEVRNKMAIYLLTSTLYQMSHSLILFFSAFSLVWFVRWRKGMGKGNATRFMPLAMTGWFLHIAFDILTHTKAFHPTPILYPLSEYSVDGFRWRDTWFMIANYAAILLVFIVLRIQEKKKHPA